MSDRERWIVYPLILFAFLLAARDKYAEPDQASFRTIRCQELRLVSESGKSLIDLYGSLEDEGVMVIYSHGQGGEPGDVPHVDPFSDETTLGHPVVALGGDGNLGFIEIYGHDANMNLKLGHERANQISGLYALGSDDQLLDREGDDDEGDDDAGEPWGLLRAWSSGGSPPGAQNEVSETPASGKETAAEIPE
ncbi:MAG: hypothetical protein AAGF97_14650 [Planctomycetota bacterium]